MAIGMGNSDLGDFSGLTERILALRAVVAEAIASKAPRRTVACLGAAVAHALFGAAAPGSPSARACEEQADEKVHVGVKRRRRGKRVHKVAVEAEVAVILTDALVEVAPKEMAAEAVEVAEEVEVAEKVNEEMEPAKCAATQAAPTRKPDEPVMVYKLGAPIRERGLPDDDRDGGACRPCGHFR